MARRLAFVVAFAALLGGCAHETAADRAPRPDPVKRLAPTGEAPWREDFGDPVLQDLLRRADAGAVDIKIALARLERAQADVEVANAAQRVQVGVALAGAGGGRTLESHREVGAPTLDAGYDFDFSGRIARLREAAAAERKASAADVAYARLLVAVETSRAYVGLCSATEAAAAANHQQEIATRTLGLIKARRAEGVATAQDEKAPLAAQDAASAAGRAARGEAQDAAERLRVLTGAADIHPACPSGLPVTAPAPDTLPAGLVDRRPDVQAAFARLKVADARRAAAVAAERPQFQISAVLGAPDAAIVTLLGTRALAWALAGRVSEGLYDGGAARGRIRGATADADVADLAYRKTVLDGWSELRSAAAADIAAGQTAQAAQEAVIRAAAGLRATQTRRGEGAADGLALAQAQAQLEDARDALREAKTRAAEARIRRLLAGGGR